MVFKLDEEGNAVYIKDIEDLCIFLSKSEPFTVPVSSFPEAYMFPNTVRIWDFDHITQVEVSGSSPIRSHNLKAHSPYCIPPQNIV